MGSIRVRKDNALLFLDFRFRGQRCREQTLLADNAINRRKAEKVLATIEAQIAAGTFVYESYFPSSAATRSPAVAAVASVQPAASAVSFADSTPDTPTFRTFADQWMRDHEVEWRRSHIKVLRSTIDGHLLPHFADKQVGCPGPR